MPSAAFGSYSRLKCEAAHPANSGQGGNLVIPGADLAETGLPSRLSPIPRLCNHTQSVTKLIGRQELKV